MEDKIIYHMAEPDLTGNERNYLIDAFDSGWISSKGKYIQKFEENFANFVETKFAVSCSNGTTALHLAIRALGIGAGDEVLVPNLTFASPANAVLYEHAKPILVDVDKRYWCIDPIRIEECITEKTKAIIVVHLYGHPADMDSIMKIAKKHGLKVIEDAAEAHGAMFRDKKVGSIGDIGCFSFYGNKIVTTGEGGMIVTNDQSLADKLRMLRDHGMLPSKRYWHDEVGYNYRITNLQAAIGVAQLETISEKIEKRRWIARKYADFLDKSVELQVEMPWALNVYWLPTFIIKNLSNRTAKDSLMDKMNQHGIETRPVFYPLNEMPPYKNNGVFTNSNYISFHGISLPVYNSLKEDDIRIISEHLNESLKILTTG